MSKESSMIRALKNSVFRKRCHTLENSLENFKTRMAYPDITTGIHTLAYASGFIRNEVIMISVVYCVVFIFYFIIK